MTEINWRHNCLTVGVHDGSPEAIWNISLLHAVKIIDEVTLEELIIARIYNDAMQMVENNDDLDKAWADRVRIHSIANYKEVLKQKVEELERYYSSVGWGLEMQEAARRLKVGKLNPHWAPLHHHDTLNLLCRIIGSSASRAAS